MVVGASSIVFLIFKNSLLKSRQQFNVACIFVIVEFSALTLGAFHTFGTALGWTFDPFVTELTKLAIVLTLPIVAIEWITVLSLDPDARTQRSESASKSELATIERETRERFRMSDPVISIRNAAALTEVIHEELRRLPTEQRGMFIGILRGKHGSEFEGVPLLLPGETAMPNVIDQPRLQPAAQTMAAEYNGYTAQQLYDIGKRTMTGVTEENTPTIQDTPGFQTKPTARPGVFDEGWSDALHARISTAEAQRDAQRAAIDARPDVAAAKAAHAAAAANLDKAREIASRNQTRLVDSDWGLTPEGSAENRTPEWSAKFEEIVTRPLDAARDAELAARQAYQNAYNQAAAPKAS